MHGRVALQRERWRDVAAAYLVHRGLQLASRAARRDMMTTLACELREQPATTARPGTEN